MTEELLEKIYRSLRKIILSIPAIVVVLGIYLVLFPVDDYRFYRNEPKFSKFNIEKDIDANELSFGVFPLRNYRYINLSLDFEDNQNDSCSLAKPQVSLAKTYQSFLLPEGEPVTSKDQLKNYLFDGNKTKYPNGSLLHLKPTNEVFLISHGKKTLFPGPEIFEAFGYNFSNLVDIEQSEIEQFPDADKRIFLWTMAHPDSTIFQAFPSHSLFIIFEGKKHPVNDALMQDLWPEYFSIPVSDFDPKNVLRCEPEASSENISCSFDSSSLSSIGRYYNFNVSFPENCPVSSLQPDDSRIRFSSEKSVSVMKDSLRTIASSILNRYFYKE